MTRYKNPANPEYIHAMRELRKSNATQPYDSRPHRQRTRAMRKQAALREWE